MKVLYLLIAGCALACQKDKDLNQDIQMLAKDLKRAKTSNSSLIDFDKKISRKDKKTIQIFQAESIKSGRVYLFSPGAFSGNLGGRDGSSKLCLSAIKGEFSGKCTSFLGFTDRLLSTSIRDELGFDDKSPVYSLPKQIKVAEHWQSLFVDKANSTTPQLLISLAAAGVFGKESDKVNDYNGLFWSGVRIWPLSKKQPFHNCSDWSSDESWGRVGGNHGSILPGKENSSVKERFPWYDYRITMSCDTKQNVLCVVFLRGD